MLATMSTDAGESLCTVSNSGLCLGKSESRTSAPVHACAPSHNRLLRTLRRRRCQITRTNKKTLLQRGEAVIRFKINGSAVEHDGDGDEPLLWVIRQRVGLKGTKYGCGAGLCGACTVHVDGRAKRSCMLPVSQLDGRAVTTIEGLSANGDHPVQRAWLEIDVPQCATRRATTRRTCHTPRSNPVIASRMSPAIAARSSVRCRCRREPVAASMPAAI